MVMGDRSLFLALQHPSFEQSHHMFKLFKGFQLGDFFRGDGAVTIFLQ